MPKMTPEQEANLADQYNETQDMSEFDGGADEPFSVRRDATISVRFAAHELEQLRAQAEEAGMKVTAYIRQAALATDRPPIDTKALEQATEHLNNFARELQASIAALEPRTRAAKIELYQTATGKFTFRLKAPNGETIAGGKEYETMTAAKHAAAVMQQLAPTALV